MATVRSATAKDIPRIQELYRQLLFSPDDFKKATLDDCKKVLAEALKIPGYNLLVAEEGGEVVGTTLFAVIPAFAHKTMSFSVIEYMVVDEKRRGKGVGKALIDRCKELAKEANCYKIMLTSDNRRKEAHKFYKSMGFEASAEGFRLYF